MMIAELNLMQLGGTARIEQLELARNTNTRNAMQAFSV